jgi:hypothetical protein
LHRDPDQRPKWSITIQALVCPVRVRPMVVAAPPTKFLRWLFTPTCTGRSAPAASVSGNRKAAIPVTLPRLVDVEEDRLQTLFPDPRAVLDVAGALEVG